MDIDQTDGALYFVFYDRRNHSELNYTDVYLARSFDGGATFENFLISEAPFRPSDQVFFGDYNNISVHNGIVRPVWTIMKNFFTEIWTDITPTDQLKTRETQILESLESMVYPNPAMDDNYFSFKTRTIANVSLKLVDQQGRPLIEIIQDEEFNPGPHVHKVDLGDLGPGQYFYKLTINGVAQKLKTLSDLSINLGICQLPLLEGAGGGVTNISIYTDIKKKPFQIN